MCASREEEGEKLFCSSYSIPTPETEDGYDLDRSFPIVVVDVLKDGVDDFQRLIGRVPEFLGSSGLIYRVGVMRTTERQ